MQRRQFESTRSSSARIGTIVAGVAALLFYVIDLLAYDGWANIVAHPGGPGFLFGLFLGTLIAPQFYGKREEEELPWGWALVFYTFAIGAWGLLSVLIAITTSEILLAGAIITTAWKAVVLFGFIIITQRRNFTAMVPLVVICVGIAASSFIPLPAQAGVQLFVVVALVVTAITLLAEYIVVLLITEPEKYAATPVSSTRRSRVAEGQRRRMRASASPVQRDHPHEAQHRLPTLQELVSNPQFRPGMMVVVKLMKRDRKPEGFYLCEVLASSENKRYVVAVNSMWFQQSNGYYARLGEPIELLKLSPATEWWQPPAVAAQARQDIISYASEHIRTVRAGVLPSKRKER